MRLAQCETGLAIAGHGRLPLYHPKAIHAMNEWLNLLRDVDMEPDVFLHLDLTQSVARKP